MMHNELRAALRKFISAWVGEEEIVRLMKEEGESVDAWNDANRLPAGEKTREEVLDFLVGVCRGMAQGFKAYHAEHGCYPEWDDFPKLGWIGRLEDLGEKEKK
jgi:hypothetical protein